MLQNDLMEASWSPEAIGKVFVTGWWTGNSAAVDVGGAERARRRDVHAVRAEVTQHQRVRGGCHRMRLDEDEGVVRRALDAVDEVRDGERSHPNMQIF